MTIAIMQGIRIESKQRQGVSQQHEANILKSVANGRVRLREKLYFKQNSLKDSRVFGIIIGLQGSEIVQSCSFKTLQI